MARGRKTDAARTAKAAAVAARAAKAAEDDALLDAALADAQAARAAAAVAAAADEARRVAAAAAAAAARAQAAAVAAVPRPQDVPVASTMRALVLPPSLTATPALSGILARSRLDTEAAVAAVVGSSSSASSSAGADGSSASQSTGTAPETARERELRLREAAARMRLRRHAAAVRRSGKKAVEQATYKDPAVHYGDETAEEIATRPNLVQAHVKRYAEWLLSGMRGTGLLEDAKTCPAEWAAMFRFDAARDPVCRAPKTKLASQIDVLLVSFKRVVYFVWSDHADGLMAAAKQRITDILLAPSNVLAVLSGGRKPRGLGQRMTRLDELSALPALNAVSYPHGIPAELVLKALPHGTDLGPESVAERLARAIAADADAGDALDAADSDDDGAAGAGGTGGAGGGGTSAEDEAVDPVAALILKELRTLPRSAFPLTQAILDTFKPEAEAADKPNAHKTEDADADADAAEGAGGAYTHAADAPGLLEDIEEGSDDDGEVCY